MDLQDLGLHACLFSSGPLLQPSENCRETSLYRVGEKGKPSMLASFKPFLVLQNFSYAGLGFCWWGVLQGHGSHPTPQAWTHSPSCPSLSLPRSTGTQMRP